jgi:hypothetical protein
MNSTCKAILSNNLSKTAPNSTGESVRGAEAKKNGFNGEVEPCQM